MKKGIITKILAFCMSLVLLVGNIPVDVQAANPMINLHKAAALEETTMTVATVNAEAGASVEVPISISNNTGICGARIEVSYDEALTLTAVTAGESFSTLSLTKPGKLSANPVNLLWDGTDEDDSNGTIVILTFTAPSRNGVYDISLSYEDGDIVDGDINSVNVAIVNGAIRVGSQTPVEPEEPEKPEKPTMTVATVNAEAGASVEVPISISNNTGICGARIEVSYDEALTLTAVTAGDGFSSLSLTKPGKLSANPVNLLWDGTDEDDSNGTIVTLTFTAPSINGVYDISISYEDGDIVDGDINTVNVAIVNGAIQVGSQTPVEPEEPEVIASGVIDEEYGQITWVIDMDGKLTVTGTGDVSDRSSWDRAPWYTYRESILSAEVDVTGMTNASGLFDGCINLTSVDLEGFDTSNVTDMSNMFYGCENLQTLDVSGFDTSNVIYMQWMFCLCSNLQSLDVSGFDTSSVIRMDEMFGSCYRLKTLDLSGFDMSKLYEDVEKEHYPEDMLLYCYSLETIEAPLNCSLYIELPGYAGDQWYLADGTEITCLPKGLTESVTLYKNDYPEVVLPKVLLLDYDYYNAFIASGGSITINENAEVEVSTDNFTSEDKWTLSYLYQEFTESQMGTLIKNIASNVKEWANQYWKSDVGSFKAVNYYDTDGNVIAEDSLSEHDIVLIEYAPQIVWVDSMELTVPSEMEPNTTATATVTLDAGQDKYPFKNTPEIRYESSNPEIVAVDEETGVLTAGTVAGTATITVYADEYLRRAEGLDEIITASATITVVPADVIASGVIDEEYGQITWVIDANGKLTVTGTGDVSDKTGIQRAPWYSYRTSILSAEINVTGMKNASALFYDCNKMKSLDLEGFDTSDVTDMSSMFYRCENLQTLDVSGFDTANVKYMQGMFSHCRKLRSLDVSGFDTANVMNMQGMFSYCRELRALDVSGFDTGNVTDMSYMFEYCDNEYFVTLDVSGFDTSNVTNMSNMFSWCYHVKKLDVSGFDTSNVMNMSYMFERCRNITTLDVSGFDTSNVIYMISMFEACTKVQELDLSSFDMSKLMKEYNGGAFDMLATCNALKKIKAPLNCNVSCELPYHVTSNGERTDHWYLADGTEITYLPTGLTKSVTLYKNHFPEPEEPKTPVTEVFTDVAAGKWYIDAVQYVYDNGLMSGNDGLFKPTGNVTRAQVVTTLYNIAGKPKVTDYSACDKLIDVEAGKWYTDAVCWAYNTGVTTGDTATMKFNMSTAVTRQQLASFFFRFAEYMGYDTTMRQNISGMLNANKVSSYAKTAVEWAVGAGLISGSESKDAAGNIVYDLKPQGTASRAQLATILQRFVEKFT